MRVLFVDLDHTVMLNPFPHGVFPAMARILRASAPSRGASEADVERRLISRSLDLLRERTTRANDWDLVAADVARELGGRWTCDVAQLVRDNLRHSSVVPGAHEALQAARVAGWRVIAASQGFRRFQVPVLDYLGLAELFDDQTFSDDTHSLKRSLRFFGGRHLGAERVVSLGDQYVDDGLYPRHFGFTSIWFTGVRVTEQVAWREPPNMRLDRLDGLADALRTVASDSQYRYAPRRCARCCACLGPVDVNATRCGLCSVTDTGLPKDLEPLRKRGLVTVRDGRLLLCRPNAFPWLITAGGVGGPDEPPEATIRRELAEELGTRAQLVPGSLGWIGQFRDRAAGAPDREVVLDLWHGEVAGTLEASGEIAEIVWWSSDDDPDQLSPVVRNHVVPALRQRALLR